MLFLKNFRGAGATCVRPVLGHLDAVWQVTLTLRNDDSEAVNATFQGVAKRVLVKQNKSGVESVAVSGNPLQALDPIGNTQPSYRPSSPRNALKLLSALTKPPEKTPTCYIGVKALRK